MKVKLIALLLIVGSIQVSAVSGVETFNWMKTILDISSNFDKNVTLSDFGLKLSRERSLPEYMKKKTTTSTTSTTLVDAGSTSTTIISGDVVSTTQKTSTTIPATSTSIPVSTTIATTTTLKAETCYDDILNQNEVLTDCGGECRNYCEILDLNRTKTVKYKSFSFMYDSLTYTDRGETYKVIMKNPDNVVTNRYLEAEDKGQIEFLRYNVLGTSHNKVKLQINVISDIEKAEYGRYLMLGGKDCKNDGFCTRKYSGYKISVLDRTKQRYRVVTPDAAEAIVEIPKGKMASPDNNIGLKTIQQYVQGGYSIIQVWTIKETGSLDLSKIK